MIQIQEVTVDRSCISCTRRNREARDDVRYFSLKFSADLQFTNVIDICDSCLEELQVKIQSILERQ